jgi:hypothetical protein
MDNITLILDDHRGIYIPRDFVEGFLFEGHDWTGIDAEDIAILREGPDHDLYWDAWDVVTDNARITVDGKEFYLWQDGALFVIAVDLPEDEAEEFFGSF